MPHEPSPNDPGSETPPSPDPATAAALDALLATEEVEATVERLRSGNERTLADQAELTAIPAPPFGEEVRGRRMAELMTEAGLGGVRTDAEGNVLGWYGAPGPGPLVVAAHLDTVFPEGTDVTVTRRGRRLAAPGISDDGRGLAALLAVARALAAGPLALRRPLLFVATVGEEGVGDLRGVRHLFGPEGAGRDAWAFVSLDGAGIRRIIVQAVGSWRVRATVTGPGGHSWVDWGRANPLQALSAGIARCQDVPLPPATTFSVGRMGGGTSINAIPAGAWAEIEVRSTDPEARAEVVRAVSAALAGAVDQANARRRSGTDPLELDVALLGDRPAGGTDPGQPLVRAAVAATWASGNAPVYSASSTDANVPMSLGIPAVTLGAGGTAEGIHTLEEWYDDRGGVEGLVRALLTLVTYDELAGGPPGA
ncbi:MAG: M20/M25/M40 family metallo-hydrolase [Longimicrobiales bacterium]